MSPNLKLNPLRVEYEAARFTPEITKRLTYAEQVAHLLWQRFSAEIRNARGYACEDCGGQSSQLTIHHCYYVRTLYLWEYPPQLLKALCWDCHQKRQGREEAAHLYLARLIRDWPLERLEAGVFYWMQCALQPEVAA